MGNSSRVAVIGMGNMLLKDEGIGAHIAHALQELDLPQGTQIIDGGTSPDVLDYLEPAAKLIVIDAAEGGGTPGAIYRFRPEDLTTETGKLISLHELSLISSLKMTKLLKKEPQEVIIIGVQPKEIDWGTELSAELQAKIPEIVEVVLKEIGTDWQENINAP
jgi:hydrogenase maturation protease